MVRSLAIVAVLVLATPPGHAQAPASTAELAVRVQVLEEELRRLRGELEAQAFRQRELQAEIERLRGAGAVAETPAPTLPSAPPLVPSAPPATMPGPATPGTPPGTLGDASSPPGTPVDRPAVGTGSASFQDGMALLQAGRYADARATLDRFVAGNPTGSNAAEAAFWSAETLFFEGQYEAAASAFAANYRAFGPQAPRATDSLLKVAMSLNRLGDESRACVALDELASRHGNLGRSLEAAVRRERQNAGCP